MAVKTRALVAAAFAGALASGCGLVGNEGERQAAVVRGICLDCHNATEQVAGLNLEKLPFDAIGAHAETWEHVIRKLRAGLMPPADGGPTLERDARESLAAWLESSDGRKVAASMLSASRSRIAFVYSVRFSRWRPGAGRYGSAFSSI